MVSRRRAATAAIIFTLAILVAVNLGWWFYYSSIKAYLEMQLSHRLSGTAATAALQFTADDIDRLLIDDLDAYSNALLYLDSLTILDSLSEAAIIDLDFNYLVSTGIRSTSEGYLLAQLNFDSLHQATRGRPTASALYNIDGTYLKSAYAPLPGTEGDIAAILVIEAGAGYFDLLDDLKRNLYFLAGGSAGTALVLLFFYILYNRRMAAAEEQIFQAASQAALGRMVAVVSHEIKNPLMIIRAAGERIEKKYTDPEASFIVEEVARLDNIVTSYLSFARGGLSLHLEAVNVEKMAHKIISEYNPQFHEQEVSLISEIQTGLPRIMADRTALRQVFINLLLNGLHAAAEGIDSEDRQVKIEIQPLPQTRGLEILVSDSGDGIKASQRDRIFEPFYTTKVKGSGLGLYLSRRIIEEHRGTIKIINTYKGMTTFEVSLPAGDIT